MSEKPKIIFIHKGDSWFLPYALHQAITHNPDDTILLSDQPPQKHFKGIHQVTFNDSDTVEVAHFKQSYKHMSTNSVEFEIFCWLRWFHLLDLMKKENITSAFYLDTDVMLYASACEMFNHFSESGELWCGFSIPEHADDSLDWTASGHTSYWTLESLEDFCKFITQSFSDPIHLAKYNKKWSWHQKNNVPGGICDMTTLFLFWREYSSKINNFAKTQNKCVIDHNANLSLNYSEQEYLMNRRIKAIKTIDGKGYFHRIAQNDSIRAFSIHFQGGAKKYMALYYQGSRFYLKNATSTLLHIGKIFRGWRKLQRR